MRPESIDFDALYASFGLNTMFTLLPAEYPEDSNNCRSRDTRNSTFTVGEVPKVLEYI